MKSIIRKSSIINKINIEFKDQNEKSQSSKVRNQKLI